MYAEIKVNSFTLENLDLSNFDYPKPTVRTWSNLFNDGGKVSLEAHVGESTLTLAEIKVERDGSVLAERRELQALADDFTEDLHENWDRLITDALAKNAAYYARTTEESATKLASVQAKIEAFEAHKVAQVTL